MGLSLIYIQAKRYSRNRKVKISGLQAFVGAMKHINKGVFITTSTYTKEAIDYSKSQQQKSLKLIEGKLLVKLMIKYEIGVSSVEKISVYKMDNDYFME